MTTKLQNYLIELSKANEEIESYDQEVKILKEQLQIVNNKRLDILLRKERLKQLIREF